MKDDVQSQYSYISKSTIRSLGGKSMRSSRTYTSQLERKLHEEKQARHKLEREVEELRKLSSAIASRISQSNQERSAYFNFSDHKSNL